MIAPDTSPQIASVRPGVSAIIMAGTGLDEEVLPGLVLKLYGKVRRDPIFAACIADLGAASGAQERDLSHESAFTA